jgi:DNA-binding transcriptional regulator WhiA
MISKKKVKEEILENISVEAGDLKAFLYAVTVSSGSLILSDKKLSLTIENDEAVVLLKFIEGLKKEYNVNASLFISGGAGEKTSGTDKKKNEKHGNFNEKTALFDRKNSEKNADFDLKNDKKIADFDPKNGEKIADFDPKNSEKNANFDPKNDKKTADFDPKNGEKTVNFDPKNGEKHVDFDQKNGEKTVKFDLKNDKKTTNFDLKNDKKTADFDPKNDKKTTEFNRKNNENSVITERKKRGKSLEIGEKDTATVLSGLCAAEFFEGKLVNLTDGLPEKYRDFEGIKSLLQAAFLKNGVLRTPDADDDGGYYMGEKGQSEHGDYDAKSALNLENVVNERENSGRGGYTAGALNSEDGVGERENSGRGGYYAEVMFDSERLASDVVFELNKYGIKAKILERNESYAVYIKDGESVGGFLALVQAHGNALELQEILVMREERNNSNRRANCDSHNLDKSAEASVGQALAIAKITGKGGLDALSDELKKTADIRTKNPMASLNELAEILGVSKSCVQHRLKRLADIAGAMGD